MQMYFAYSEISQFSSGGLVLRVLFVNPLSNNNHEPQALPLGLLSIATAAKNNGHTVFFLDRTINSRNVKKLIQDFQPQIVGLSVISPNVLKDVKTISSYCKKQGITIVCGGLFATLGAEAILNDSIADLISIGEGEGTWVELLNTMGNGGSWKEIKGIAYLENGTYKRTSDRPFLSGIELPILDFSLVDVKKYLHPYHDCERMTFLYSSKGCNGACTFCFNQAFHKSTHRKRPMENVLTEIRYLQEHYNVDGIYFADELWATNKRDILEKCAAIAASGLNFVWGAQIRVGILDRGDYEYLYRCGCRWLYFGIESGCPERLKSIKKNINLDRVLADVKSCYEIGITIWSSVIIGFPDETEEEIRQTVELCKKISKYAINQCFIFAPTLGSEIFYELKRNERIENLTTLKSLTQFIWDRVGVNYSKVPTKDLNVVSTYVLWWAFTFQTSSRGNTKHGFTLSTMGNALRTIFKSGPAGAIKSALQYAHIAIHYGRYLFFYPGVKKKYNLKIDKSKF